MSEVAGLIPISSLGERNGQPHCPSLVNLEGGRIRFSHKGGSMMLHSTKDKHWKMLS